MFDSALKSFLEFYENGYDLDRKIFKEAYWWAINNGANERTVGELMKTYCQDLIDFGCLNEDFACTEEVREVFWKKYGRTLSYYLNEYMVDSGETLEEVFLNIGKSWDSMDMFALNDHNKCLVIDLGVAQVCYDLMNFIESVEG